MKRSLRGRGSFGRLLLCALLAGATSAPVSADQYGYDELGNVETLSNPRGVRSYTYDEIQRLDTETGYSGNRDHAYDLNGNRTTDGASAPGTPTTATYTSNTNRIATLNGAAVTLDAAGQITNDGLNSYTWDDAGRLKTVSRGGQLRATYYYDHKHRRTRKVTTAAAPQGAKTLVYHYDDQDRLIAETTETGAPVRSYLWADTTLLAQVEYTLNATTGLYTVSRELLFELDHLGTPRQARLTGGSAVWRWESDGYGNTLPNEDPDGNGQKTYVYLRFPGQYYDEESGLHYNWHRYYVPRLGRYLSSDPIGVVGGINTYGYVEGNPTVRTDPNGLASTKIDGNNIQVHKNDVDPWPSKPHGHIYDKNQVIDKDGNIYDKNTKEKIGSFSKRSLSRWANFLKKIEGKMCLPLMVHDIAKAYCQEYPWDSSCLFINIPSSGECAGVPGCI